MPERSKDWMKQSIKDLEAAEEMMKKGFYEWSCFIAQQSAEKAVKALVQKINALAWGHSVFEILTIISKKLKVNEEVLDCAKILDKYYIPTRYPNSFDSGSPYEYFTKGNAEDAIVCCKRIIEFCNSLLA